MDFASTKQKMETFILIINQAEEIFKNEYRERRCGL